MAPCIRTYDLAETYLQELFLEEFLLGVGPHVLELAVVELLERIEDEAVVAGELALPLLVGQQHRRDHRQLVHLLVLVLLQKGTIGYIRGAPRSRKSVAKSKHEKSGSGHLNDYILLTK